MRSGSGSSPTPTPSEPLSVQDSRRPRTSPRLSSPGLALLPWVFLLANCDLFSTKDFSPKPSEIRTFVGSFPEGDTLTFRVTEFLSEPDSKAAPREMSRKFLRFARAAEPFQPGGGWTAVSIRITSDPGDVLLDQGVLLLDLEVGSLALQGPDSPAGGAEAARYHPLKVAASRPAAGLAFRDFNGGSGDSILLSLPPAFTLGLSPLQALGILEVAREIEDTDTLNYRSHLEEAWRIAETVLDGDRAMARGRFWYGASGLLKGEQTWEIEGRAMDGSPSTTLRLRRELARL